MNSDEQYAILAIAIHAAFADVAARLPGPAKALQAQYLPQIRNKAATLDAGQIMAMMRA